MSTSLYSRVPGSTPANRDPARTEAQAKSRFLDVLGRTLAAVHPHAVWNIAPRPDGSWIVFTVPAVIELGCDGDERLFLRSTIRFVYVDSEKYPREKKVSTLEYAHTVGRTPELKPQLYSWEWNSAEPRYPHVHVRRGDPDHKGLGKLHIATGRVFLETVLLFLADDHGVRWTSENARQGLLDSLDRVMTYSTWGGGALPGD